MCVCVFSTGGSFFLFVHGNLHGSHPCLLHDLRTDGRDSDDIQVPDMEEVYSTHDNARQTYTRHAEILHTNLTYALQTTSTSDLSTQKYFCQYSEQPMSIVSNFWPDFFADGPPISQNKTVSIFLSFIS